MTTIRDMRPLLPFLFGGPVLYFFRGFDVSALGSFAVDVAKLAVGISLLSFVFLYGWSVVEVAPRFGRARRFFIFLCISFFFSLYLVSGLGAYFSALLFQSQFSMSLTEYFPLWFEHTYDAQFRSPQFSFWSRYASDAESVTGPGDVVGLLLTIVINFVPEYVMYSIAHMTTRSVAVINYCVQATYWMLPTLFVLSVTPHTRGLEKCVRYLAKDVEDRIFFEANSARLNAEAIAVLDRQATWLQGHTTDTARIEGHADEQGSEEYNIFLGALRAKAARDYLWLSGVPLHKLRTISYGRDRRLEFGRDDQSWSQNRRAVTVLERRESQRRRPPIVKCPPLIVREGASIFSMHRSEDRSADSLCFQAMITRTACECILGDETVYMRIGVKGKIAIGPAGEPGPIIIPLRIAIVCNQNSPQVIASKPYRVPASIEANSEKSAFVQIADDLTIEVASSINALQAYIAYVGFDPEILRSNWKVTG